MAVQWSLRGAIRRWAVPTTALYWNTVFVIASELSSQDMDREAALDAFNDRSSYDGVIALLEKIIYPHKRLSGGGDSGTL
jgi:hypothetical protein